MKLIRKADGTLEIDGTPEEVRALLAEPVDAVGTMLPQAPSLPPLPSVPTVFTVRAGQGWAHNNAAACVPNMGQTWVGTIRPFGTWGGSGGWQ